MGRSSEYGDAIKRDGISSQSASRYQALAAVPAEVFDEAIRNPDASPTVRGLVEQARDPAPQIHREVRETLARAEMTPTVTDQKRLAE